MKILDYFRTAFKNLLRQKARTILTIIAITVGSLSLILMASVIISIRDTLVDQFQDLGAFDLVTVIKDPNSSDQGSLIGSRGGDPSEGKKIDEATLSSMQKFPHVAQATPTLAGFYIKTMRLEGTQRKTWGNIIAYDPDNDVFELSMSAGRKLQKNDLDKIVISSRFLQEIRYDGDPKNLIGKKAIVSLGIGGGSAPDWGALPEKPPMNADKEWYEAQNNKSLEIPLEIVGVLGGGVLDSGQSYITLGFGRRLMTSVRWEYDDSARKTCEENQRSGNQPTRCDSVASQKLVKDDESKRTGYASVILKVDDTANIEAVAAEVEKLGYGATTAKDMLDQINNILLTISIVLAIIGGISLFVASIGIINTMIMAIYERTHEIGVMRACGATRATVRRLFTFEAGLLGFFGGVFGVGVSYGIGQVANLIASKYGGPQLGDLPLDKIVSFPWWLIASVIGFTSLLGVMSGFFPALRASRLNPVEALRYE